jgi:protein involved in polysaccharide export with SLBB domain
MTNAPTLLEAFAQAGGTLSLAGQRDLSINNSIDDQADLSRSFIVRHGRMLPVDFERLINEGDLSQNIYLEPDDFVYVPPLTARNVYVMGAVGLPRAVPYQEGLTMTAAIANTGGPIREAYLSHVAVVRGSLSQPKIALIDYRDVVRGKVPDVILQPHDIVYVPFEPYRYLVRYGDLIMNTFVSSVAINEGIRAVSDGHQVTQTGVFIPVGSGVTVTAPPTIIGPPAGR